jgi:hypothetical protein
MTTPYQCAAHRGVGSGMREIDVCNGCPTASDATYARQLLVAVHPEWTLMRLHDRALIHAMKMRGCAGRISDDG